MKKNDLYFYAGLAVILLAILIPVSARLTKYIQDEKGNILDGNSDVWKFIAAYWKAKIFGKGLVIGLENQPTTKGISSLITKDFTTLKEFNQLGNDFEVKNHKMA